MIAFYERRNHGGSNIPGFSKKHLYSVVDRERVRGMLLGFKIKCQLEKRVVCGNVFLSHFDRCIGD